MIPNIQDVRAKAKKNFNNEITAAMKFSDKDPADIILDAMDYFYELLSSDINNQLLEGLPASCKLNFDSVNGYILRNNYHRDMGHEICFEILDAVFSMLHVRYISAGYSALVDKHIGAKSNFNAYYASYYVFKVRF